MSSIARPPDETPDQTAARRSLGGLFRAQEVEATTGFEPVNRGFADLRVEPLHHVAPTGGNTGSRFPRPVFSLAAPRGFEPRLTDPKSAVLPLDEGAAATSRGAHSAVG